MSATLQRLLQNGEPALRQRPQPDWVDPMLATLTEQRFSDPDWIFERKLDGERCLVFRRGKQVALRSRNRKAINNHYPELTEEIESQRPDRFIADGEIVAFERGRTSFSRLQGRMQVRDPDAGRRTGTAVYLYLFDLLYLDRYLITGLGLRLRKRLLREALSFSGRLRATSHRNAEGEDYYREACRRGWEGVIAKRASAPYVHRRSGEWLKFKCVNQQELVVVGYTEPRGKRRRLGALLVGYHEDAKLRYAGKVGTGFDSATLEHLGDRVERLERDSSPLDGELPRERGVHWVRPELVAEIGFTEWTRDGRLRHPRYLGLRTDKPAREVVRERAAPVGP
jgi:bifunctional non-homologous end joining protein LigD